MHARNWTMFLLERSRSCWSVYLIISLSIMVLDCLLLATQRNGTRKWLCSSLITAQSLPACKRKQTFCIESELFSCCWAIAMSWKEGDHGATSLIYSSVSSHPLLRQCQNEQLHGQYIDFFVLCPRRQTERVAHYFQPLYWSQLKRQYYFREFFY